jgi:ABC-type antimicrobial peptide transport system permease subunit
MIQGGRRDDHAREEKPSATSSPVSCIISHGPLTFLGAGVMSLVIAAIACLWPARRATTIPPMVALRSE